MNREEIKEYFVMCVRELFSAFKEHREWYGNEDDIHYDLYFLLNHKNGEFWKNRSVMAEYTREGSGDKIDLIVYMPGKESIALAIEIKFDTEDYHDRRREYNAIEYDFFKLRNLKKEEKEIIPIFLFFGDTHISMPKMKEIAKNYIKKYPEVDCILAHTKEKDILLREDLLK